MKKPLRRKLLVMSCALAMGIAGTAASAAYPEKDIRFITAFAAGSASDIVARLIAERLQAALGQPVVVENKAGASGQIAANYVAKSAPDGYTIMLATNTTHSANPYLFKTLHYDPIKDFTPIAQICNFPFVLAVSGKLPVNNVKELLAYGRKHASNLSYAYGNSTGQISAAAFDKATGLHATPVPYKSSPQAMTDVIGGRASFMFADLASAGSYIKSGKLKLLGVTTSQRSSLAPALPTIASAIGQPGFDLAAWVGIFGPAHMPQPVVQRLSSEIVKIVSSADMRERLNHLGAEPTPAPAGQFGPFVARQLAVWGQKVKEAGIPPQ
ncbi:Bug family tripartite tricarboxylate transporter substrate binding protein [Candidimonas nitroreducens]|uniref:ABC transporter substrate-binding protein n=1 Tax=Candidimonas nitroreducens TaxID=683354 RepID=A0A225MG52_9BURK|nr:tripartite tricarboxylate transporter substrate binding protein [Candidimonas nitroreducens]OWT60168.1 ABC transporter substrate-binding protein [Candidimonas nitroreducens]